MASPLVSVVITNFNHERFVGCAIESALAQSYPRVEVVVVDDGSKDDSKLTIAQYETRIIAIYKEHGGQASALNAGFARSTGEIIALLDADDMLLDHTVARLVTAFQENPGIGLVQMRVEVVDAAGSPLGVFVPACHIRMPNHDLRARLDDFRNNSWWSPTSGLAVDSQVLSQVLPLPEDRYRVSADHAVCRASALCAPVVSLEYVGAYYRSHSANASYSHAPIDVEKVRTDMKIVIDSHEYLQEFAKAVGVDGYPADPDRQLDTLTQRLVLLKLGSRSQRLPRDTLPYVTWHGSRAALRRTDISGVVKLVHAFWFLAMAVSPHRVAGWLARIALLRDRRRLLDRVLARASTKRVLA